MYWDRSKVRVYELAKEFGVESNAEMAKLQERGEQSKRSPSGITVYEFARQFGVESQFVIGTLQALGRNIDRRQPYELWRKEVFPDTAAPQQSATPTATVCPAAPARPADPPMAGRPPSHRVEPPRRASAQPPGLPGQGQPVGRSAKVEEGSADGQPRHIRTDQDGRSHPLRHGGAQTPGPQRPLAAAPRAVFVLAQADPRIVEAIDVISPPTSGPTSDLTPEAFESFVQNLFTKMGYETDRCARGTSPGRVSGPRRERMPCMCPVAPGIARRETDPQIVGIPHRDGHP